MRSRFDYSNYIATCHKCGARLHWRWGQNIYSGGPWYCGCCGANVTEDIYGKDYNKKKVKQEGVYETPDLL